MSEEEIKGIKKRVEALELKDKELKQLIDILRSNLEIKVLPELHLRRCIGNPTSWMGWTGRERVWKHNLNTTRLFVILIARINHSPDPHRDIFIAGKDVAGWQPLDNNHIKLWQVEDNLYEYRLYIWKIQEQTEDEISDIQ